jgi:hypothetical protein
MQPVIKMAGQEAKETIAPSFQFVSITKPGDRWKDHNEHIVRSHVMRQVRKRQKLEKKASQRELESSLVAKQKTDRRYGLLLLMNWIKL